MSDTPASKRGWGPGWPNCQPGTIVTITRPDGLRLPVRREIAPLVAWLIAETERRGYDVKPGQTWGYACRAIRGSHTASNHSWGLAVDINAPANPMTSHLVTDMPDWMPELWARYGFRWGGTYRTRPDAMHYEFMGTPADAARYTAQITGTAPAVAWTPFSQGDTDKTVAARHGEPFEVTEAQLELKAVAKKWGDARLDPDKPDGAWGRASVAAWVAFQRRIVLLQAAQGVKVWEHIDGNVTRAKIDVLRWWAR